MTYSNFGYLTSTKVGNQLLSSNTYNEKNGNMLQTVYGNGDKLNYTYDNIGNVTSVKQNDELTNSSVYNNRGLLMTDNDHINGLSTDYGYDTINRITGKKVHTLDSMQSIFATEYKYDINSQITQIVNTAGGRRYSQNYEYGKDGLLTKYTFSNTKTIDYTYDGLSRLNKKTFDIGADNDLITKYLYKDSDRRQPVMECYTTNFIKSEILNNHNYSYDYDALGNIIRISEKTRVDIGNPKEVVSYEYDDLSQLTRENNKNLNQTITYEYDSGGNILNKKIYPLTIGEITGSPTETITYSYENSNWCDQLTAYNGQQITYDEIGNPINYLGYNMSWFGRQLNSLSGNGLDVSYAYDQSGTRISKTVNGVKYEYQYDGSKLFYEKRDNAEFYYQYDCSGNLSTIIHYDGNGNRAQYYVLCNSHGDVVDIYNQDGTIAAHYIYDSWGKTVSILDNDVNGNEITDPNNIGIINQIRYRGYYLDTETGYYYLMSRYYNPEIGRFLNADALIVTKGVIHINQYAYCYNNPINFSDAIGYSPDNNIVMAIFQGLCGAILINGLLESCGDLLTGLFNWSFNNGFINVFQELIYTTIAIVSSCALTASNFLSGSIYANVTSKSFSILSKTQDLEFDAVEKAGSFGKFVGILGAFVNFSDNMDKRGQGVFGKNTDTVLALISLVCDIGGSLFGDEIPFLGTFISFTGENLPRIIAMRIEGFVVC